MFNGGRSCIECGASITRYSRGRCKACGVLKLKRPVPDDFVATLRLLGSQLAAAHYHASLQTVTRWRRECGYLPHERRKAITRTSMRPKPFSPIRETAPRDMTIEAQARDHLARFGAVYRCDPSGRPTAKGTHWRRNFRILTSEELVMTAAKLGFEPARM